MRRSTLRLYRRQVSAMDKRKPLRIDNSFSPDFMEFICWTSHVSRGVACCASILPRQEKTAGNTINIFVILLIVIGLCETSLRIDNSLGTNFTDYTGNVSRGAACCASIAKQQEKTAENTINIFVILLIVIGLCETSL